MSQRRRARFFGICVAIFFIIAIVTIRRPRQAEALLPSYTPWWQGETTSKTSVTKETEISIYPDTVNSQRPNEAVLLRKESSLLKSLKEHLSDLQTRETTYKSTDENKTRVPSPAVVSDAQIVVIVAYMRTGSTLTASILQECPESFYVFEPLRAVHQEAGKNSTAVYLDGRNRDLISNRITKESKLTVENWLRCDLKNLDIATLTDHFLERYSKTMAKFVTCYKKNLFYQMLENTGNGTLDKRSSLIPALKSCAPAAANVCVKSKVRIFKFIRLRMKTVRDLMSSYPNMKVIHLVRDPRGVLDSWIRVNLLGRNNVHNAARQLCRNMYNDLYHSKLLLEKYPDRLMVLQYETLTEFPLEVAERMYKFTDLPFTSDVKRYVINMTSNSGGDSCAFCTQRGNSTETANKWRQHINQFQFKIINSECKQVYRLLGYKLFDSFSDVKNTSLSNHIQADIYTNIMKFSFNTFMKGNYKAVVN